MNFRKMINELVDIQRNPRLQSVRIEVDGPKTTYRFSGDNYYYPAGIRRITIARGGAGVVYVYTSDEPTPHLTIPDSGTNLHWTTTSGRSEDFPDVIQRFIDLFPDE